MRILVVLDQHPYSSHAIREAAKLAMNTWADVTLLGVFPKINSKRPPNRDGAARQIAGHPLTKALLDHRERFISHFDDEALPYRKKESEAEMVEVENGIWEDISVYRGAIKDLKTRVRLGNPAKAILAESWESGSDLVVVACGRDNDCKWNDGLNIPQKIAKDAGCSVLVVKEEEPAVKKIVCCLDHDYVSQDSLEMINQMVTLHNAELEIVVLTESENLKFEVERKVDAILKYYRARQLLPMVQVVETFALENFISKEARRSLMALWMGEKSILEKIFPRRKVEKLVKTSLSSVLLLR